MGPSGGYSCGAQKFGAEGDIAGAQRLPPQSLGHSAARDYGAVESGQVSVETLVLIPIDALLEPMRQTSEKAAAGRVAGGPENLEEVMVNCVGAGTGEDKLLIDCRGQKRNHLRC